MRVATLALAWVAVSSVSSAPLPDDARRSLYGNSVDHATSQLESRAPEGETVIKDTANVLKDASSSSEKLIEDATQVNTQQMHELDHPQSLETLTTPSRQPSFKEHSGTQEKNLERSSSLKQDSGADGGNKGPNEAVEDKILDHLAEDEGKKGEKGDKGKKGKKSKEVEMIPKPTTGDKLAKALAYTAGGTFIGAGTVVIANAVLHQKKIDACLKVKKEVDLSGECRDYLYNSTTMEAAQKRQELGIL